MIEMQSSACQLNLPVSETAAFVSVSIPALITTFLMKEVVTSGFTQPVINKMTDNR
jgi:hypothetical protein